MLFFHITDYPGFQRMASEAIRSQLRLMNVGVARCAIGTLFCKHKLAVARSAWYKLMSALQRESGRAVIKGRILPHLPGFGRMADVARDLDIAVR